MRRLIAIALGSLLTAITLAVFTPAPAAASAPTPFREVICVTATQTPRCVDTGDQYDWKGDEQAVGNGANALPGSATGMMYVNGGPCTGFFVNTSTFITAAHCVTQNWGSNPLPPIYDRSILDSMYIRPGYNAAGSPPTTSVATCSAYWVAAQTNAQLYEHPGYDVAVVRTTAPCVDVSQLYPINTASTAYIGAGYSGITGYPWDYCWDQWGNPCPLGAYNFTSVAQMTSEDVVYGYQVPPPVLGVSGSAILHRIDTKGGNSGSPLWRWGAPGGGCYWYCAAAVHTGYQGEFSTFNRAVPLQGALGAEVSQFASLQSPPQWSWCRTGWFTPGSPPSPSGCTGAEQP